MNAFEPLFASAQFDPAQLQTVSALSDPRRCYIIAMTPRSGSTYLCDVLRQTHRFGIPQEVLGELAIQRRLTKIPARNADEYLCHVLRVQQSANKVSGLKASWFQWQNFIAQLAHPQIIKSFKFIYLTRKNRVEQAISLYKATQSKVFHTVGKYDTAALQRLAELDYNEERIAYWYQHILVQEQGWSRYFTEYKLTPLTLYYEDIDQNIASVLQRIALHVGVKPNNVHLHKKPSAYRKISDERNQRWVQRFLQSNHAVLSQKSESNRL